MEVKSTQQQDNLSKAEQLALSQAKLWEQVAQSEGFLKEVKPFLTDKLNQSFPDPSKFTKEEEFVYAAKVASIYKKVIAELLQIFDMKTAEVKFLEDKAKGITDPFAIGEEILEVTNNGS